MTEDSTAARRDTLRFFCATEHHMVIGSFPVGWHLFSISLLLTPKNETTTTMSLHWNEAMI